MAIMPILASEALLRKNMKTPSDKMLPPSEYWTQASDEPLIPSPTLSFLD